jgi:hypothetical protein
VSAETDTPEPSKDQPPVTDETDPVESVIMPDASTPENLPRLTLLRPDKIEPRLKSRKTGPTKAELEQAEKQAQVRAKEIAKDSLVQASARHADSAEVLQAVRTEIAIEAAALHQRRLEEDRFGRDTSAISSRRIDALKKIADIEFDIRKLGVGLVDLRGEKFQRVFALWIDMMKEVARETLSPEQSDLFFNRLTSAMDGWEDKASEAMEPRSVK